MNKTKIEYLDYTWNITHGCSPVSEGCTNCYALAMSKRLAGMGAKGYESANPFKVVFCGWKLDEPSKVKKSSRIGVSFMGDLFHEDLKRKTGYGTEWERVCQIYDIMLNTDWHTFLILTKRPENAKEFYKQWIHPNDPINHIWLGVTAENQKRYDERWTILSKIPASIKFVSLEPALEHINIDIFAPWPDWVIWGPETGPVKRPFKKEWAESVYEQCQRTGVPFFDKTKKNWIAREFPRMK